MSSLVEATSQLPLSNLDYWERLIRLEFSSALDSSSRSKWKVLSKSSLPLTWLDLISWDGYKREKALRTISGAAPNSFFFALAIRRLNDWVPQVRKAARQKLPLIVKESEPVHVIDALCITLLNWNSWGRIEDQGTQVLLEIISNEKIGSAIKLKLISSASGPMASLFTQVGRTSVLDKYIKEIAENAIQPSVRANAYRSQFEKRMAWVEGRKWEWTDIQYCKGRLIPIISERKLTITTPLIELLKKSSGDRSAIVRRISAEFLIRELETLGEEAQQLARVFSLDKSPSVSERGKFALKKLEESMI